jgi:hypothetical protein
MMQLGRSPKTLAAVYAVAALAIACGGSETAPPAASAAVSLSHTTAALGSPIEITYTFVPAADAAFDEDYRVMVHVVDIDEELMWTDDHDPPTPTSRWTPGSPIEYTRTVFIPIYPYVGEAAIHVGLYSTRTQSRLPLSGGEHVGQNAYKVASIQLLPQTENVLTLFKDGWHPAEVDTDPSISWQWTRKSATLSFRNPKRDVVFYFDVDNPGSNFKESQQVTISLDGQPVQQLTVNPTERALHKIPLTTAQLGDGEMTDLQIDVDKTFVPALMPESTNKDARELGVRVFHAFIAPVESR